MVYKQEQTINDWYKQVREYTLRLVHLRSVSPGSGENEVAQEVLKLLCEDGFDSHYTTCGLDPLESDLYNRHNAFAFLRGQSSATLVLLGHIDTVDTKDYGPAEQFSLDPERLADRHHTLLRAGNEATYSDDWMFGRGTADMKSGVAINIALMRRLVEASRHHQLPLSVVLLATPDEENESAGVLQAVHFLHRLREQYQLDYVGAINTDYTTALYPDDPHRYVYMGTVGKLLPSFLCIGRESHVGAPFNGIDANLLAAELIRDLSMNDELCDIVRGQITAPPVTLHATDLKSHYDVQLPFAAYFYLNTLTLSTDPRELLERLQTRVEHRVAELLKRIDTTEQRWNSIGQMQVQEETQQPRSGAVLTYADLYNEVVQRLGLEYVHAQLAEEWQRWPATLDKRERSLHLVYHLWTLSGRQGPAVILYYSPPYYPHVAGTPGVLQEAIATVIADHPEHHLVLQEYFPYLSDLSYLRLDPGIDVTTLKTNMPVWRDRLPGETMLPGSYSLPLEAIQRLNIPVANFGPYGFGAHQRDERLLMSYSFGILPELLYETIQHLAKRVE